MNLLDSLVGMMLDSHPTPWIIEYDWCVEVYDVNHDLVIKLESDSDAKELVSFAELLAIRRASSEAEIEMMLEPVVLHKKVMSLRKDVNSPTFLASDRSPGTYHEFLEHWNSWESTAAGIPKWRLMRIKSDNFFDIDSNHGFFKTGRRFELFDVVSKLFLEDMGIPVFSGMFHIEDEVTSMVYRFRQV